jgi:hypothetical protein
MVHLSGAPRREAPATSFEVERDNETDLIFKGRSLARLDYPDGSSIELFETEKGVFIVAVVDIDQYGNETHHASIVDSVDGLVAWFDNRYGTMSRAFKSVARRCGDGRPDILARAIEIVE